MGAEQKLRQAFRVEIHVLAGLGHGIDSGVEDRVGWELDQRIAHHQAGCDMTGGDDRHGPVGPGPDQMPNVAGGQDVESDVSVRFADPDLVRPVHRAVKDLEVGDDSSALLAQAGLVEAPHRLVLQQGGGSEYLVDGHDAGATDSHEVEVRHGTMGTDSRGREPRAQGLEPMRRPLRLRSGFRNDGDEGRAVAVEAGVVGVAGRLMDLGLPAELGFDRGHAEAIRFDAAVAAALADPFVDEHPHRTLGRQAPFPLPAEVGGAMLVVDQRGDALDFAKKFLGLIEPFPRPQIDTRRQRDTSVLLNFVGQDDRPPDALGLELASEVGNADRPVGRLAAGHRHGSVIEDFVGDRRAGRHRLANRERSRVEQGPVADVLENVRRVGEVRRPDPLGPLGAHLGKPGPDPLHGHRHAVATDPGGRDRALGHHSRAVVGTAGTEIREPLGAESHRLDRGCGRWAEPVEPAGHDLRRQLPRQPGGHDRRNQISVEFTVAGHQESARLVDLADDSRVVGLVIENVPQKELHEGTLLFDDQHLLEAGRELAGHRWLHRIEHPDLEESNAEPFEVLVGKPQPGECFPHVQERLAGRRDAEPRGGRIDHDPVEIVGRGKSAGRFEPALHQLLLELEIVRGKQGVRLGWLPRLAPKLELG